MSWLIPLRRQRQQKSQASLPVPLIVVGNISVGGTGKTPVIIGIARHLKSEGFKPGVLARGYGSEQTCSRLLPEDAQASDYGDEPVLISRSASCPVAVGPHRTKSLKILVEECHCDVVLSDDGLQHYKLPRSYEIVLMDGARGLGNGYLLPVGPLREPLSRLQQVDKILVNQGSAGEADTQPFVSLDSLELNTPPIHFFLSLNTWRNVLTQESLPCDQLPLKDAQAIAGIGNPLRFEHSVKSLGYQGTVKSFGDHHSYTLRELEPLKDKTLLMTEKDAVKCQRFAQSLNAKQWWTLQITAELPDHFYSELIQHIKHFKR